MLQSVNLHRKTSLHSVTSNGKSHTFPYHARSKSPIASLVRFVRHPVENVGDTLDTWWDGYTKIERTQKQNLDQKKQILYLRLKEVPKRSVRSMNPCKGS